MAASIAVLVFSVFCLAFGSPLKNGWTVTGRPSAGHHLNIMLVLHIENQAELNRISAEVSDPFHPSYTNYLTFDEIIQKFAPAPQKLQKVRQWLDQHGITKIDVTPTRDFISFSCTVQQAETLFGVQYSTFVHPKLGSCVRSLDSYTLPTHIRSHVAIVSGVNNFPSSFMVETQGHSTKKRQGDQVDPQFIWKAFNTGGQKGTNTKNIQAVAQFLGQYFDPADLASFQQTFNLANQPIAKVIGPNDPTNPGDEASLDVEYITGTAPGIQTWFVSTGGEHEGQERFLVWAQGLNSYPILPYVHSVSYGDYENTIDIAYADRLEVEFQKLAARGITVLFSSGDNGVGCTSSCVNVPNWPAESSMVTAVGGFNPDFTADSISSGGFSNYFGQPTWQKTAVTNYLKGPNGLPPSSQYNASGRGVPDVSAFSENVIIVTGGSQEPVGGTSCASPTFAGIISLINDALLNSGKRTVGYINPALYSIAASTPKAFIDITSGNNAYGCCNGFNAAVGWDPITGLGGPNFPVLRDAFRSFQDKK